MLETGLEEAVADLLRAKAGAQPALAPIADHVRPAHDVRHVVTQGVMRRLRHAEHPDDRVKRLAKSSGGEAHEGDGDHAADDDHESAEAEEDENPARARASGTGPSTSSTPKAAPMTGRARIDRRRSIGRVKRLVDGGHGPSRLWLGIPLCRSRNRRATGGFCRMADLAGFFRLARSRQRRPSRPGRFDPANLAGPLRRGGPWRRRDAYLTSGSRAASRPPCVIGAVRIFSRGCTPATQSTARPGESVLR